MLVIFFKQSTQQRNMSVAFLFPTTGHVALAGYYNHLPLLLILYFLHPQQAPQQVLTLFLEQ